MIAQTCSLYGWTPDYVLDGLSFDQILLYHKRGIEFEETKAKILIATYASALNPDHETKSKKVEDVEDQTPDRAAFHRAYGSKIKRA